jgi:hypothetical protein
MWFGNPSAVMTHSRLLSFVCWYTESGSQHLACLKHLGLYAFPFGTARLVNESYEKFSDSGKCVGA